MLSVFQSKDWVQYVCCCGSKYALSRLYFCRHCLKLRCGECVCHEVDSHYCPNCLESLPSAEAKLKKNRCANCFDCPSCQHVLSTRATTIPVPSADDPSKSVPKKVYYLACGFCRWTSRDVAIQDQAQATGGWPEQENPNAKRLGVLLDYYRQLAQKEKIEKERKKYTRRRSYIHFSARIDWASEEEEKYGLSPMAARKRASLSSMSTLSLKDNEEANKVSEIKSAVASADVEQLDEAVYTEPLVLAKVSTMKQRLVSPEFQPSHVGNMYPLHKHLLIKRSQRCRECEHNLCKPEFSPSSIKFKIQLVAMYFVPELRLSEPPRLEPGKETRLVLTLCNPADHQTSVLLTQADSSTDTAKMRLPTVEMQIAPSDDTAEFDDTQAEVKDDPNVDPLADPVESCRLIAFRKTNKIGFHAAVTPTVDKGEVKATLNIRYLHRSMASALTPKDGEKKEPEILPMEHRILLNFGRVLDPNSVALVYSSESLA